MAELSSLSSKPTTFSKAVMLDWDSTSSRYLPDRLLLTGCGQWGSGALDGAGRQAEGEGVGFLLLFELQ